VSREALWIVRGSVSYDRSTLVTIVVPTFNRAAWLHRTITSALSQTHSALEVLVLDDASQDDTAERVAAFADDRIRYHRHVERVGLVRNHESGVERAASDYIVFLADDDALAPEFVERRLRRLQAAPEAVVAFSGYEIVDEHLAPMKRFEPPLPTDRPLTPQELLEAALSRSWSINSAMYVRSALTAVWPRVTGVGHGFDFAIHVNLALDALGTGLYGTWCDVRYTHHRGQASRGDAQLSHFAAVVRVYEDVLRRPMASASRAAIRRDFAAWRVSWGRTLAALDRVGEARSQFARAVLTDPFMPGAWTQLALSWFDPKRVGREG
jgi:glycosyltransferase involved in cell wall biosynthesis